MQGPQAQTPQLGLYAHIPFCASVCDFCAFYQEKPRRGDLERYLKGMEQECREIELSQPIDTIFWGGGTPGLLPAKDLERLGAAMRALSSQPPSEWTVEMAPSTVKAEKLKALQDMGVTRISMGVQSFNEELLKSLGRLHNPSQVYKAWDLIQSYNFQSTNMDLIFAIPGQSMDDWMEDLNTAISLSPGHISTYCLTFEEDTPLYVKLSQGKVQIDLEKEADLYLKTWDVLESAGYMQYEISNFAKPGHASFHNIHYWDMQSWLGLGPSAASQYKGKRFSHPASIDAWFDSIEGKERSYVEVSELDDDILATDAFVFGLRMNAGVDLARLQKRFPGFQMSKLDPLWQELKEEGLILQKGDTLCLTDRGRLVADRVGAEIISV